METNERCTTAPLHYRTVSVKTAEPVGTEESSTSSSSNIEEKDYIPQWVRDIVDSKGPENFFTAHYLNEDDDILVSRQWLFEGRNKRYEGSAIVINSGRCVSCLVTYQGRTNYISPEDVIPGKIVEPGESIIVTLIGAFIP